MMVNKIIIYIHSWRLIWKLFLRGRFKQIIKFQVSFNFCYKHYLTPAASMFDMLQFLSGKTAFHNQIALGLIAPNIR